MGKLELQMKAQRDGLYLCRNIKKNQGQLTGKWGQNKGAILQYRSKVILRLTDTDCRYNIVKSSYSFIYAEKIGMRYCNCDKTLWTRR
jgi:hypothetical protein